MKARDRDRSAVKKRVRPGSPRPPPTRTKTEPHPIGAVGREPHRVSPISPHELTTDPPRALTTEAFPAEYALHGNSPPDNVSLTFVFPLFYCLSNRAFENLRLWKLIIWLWSQQ